MHRRDFLGGSLGALVAAGSLASEPGSGESVPAAGLTSPRHTKLALRPVMTNIIHTDSWEGPCRWRAVPPAQERENAKSSFARWSKQIDDRLGHEAGIELLAPVHVTFSEDFLLTKRQRSKLTRDGKQADAVLISPRGDSVAAFEIGKHLDKPIIMEGLSCRTVDISAYSRSMGQEAFVSADDTELRQLLRTLRARKVFQDTRVLFPTNRGLPAVASVASINDLRDLENRYGIGVQQITYQELAEEMDRALASEADRQRADAVAAQLIDNAHKTYIERKYVARAVQFYHTIQRLMSRHQCNAFTIECFEFCSSRLPEKWKITPCLIHTLLKDRGFASSCEADLSALLSMRLLMSVAQKSSHLGNTFLRAGGVLAVNHSATGLRLNGYDQPGLPYKLGRFVQSGWGTKAVVDFMKNDTKEVTVVRMNPTATGILVLKGKLVGSDGWEGDNLGCSVEARIVPLQGESRDFVRKQVDYGNHLVWVYGHYADQMQQLGELLKMKVELFG